MIRHAVAFSILALGLLAASAMAAGLGDRRVAGFEVWLASGLLAVALAYGLKAAGFAVEELVRHPRWSTPARVALFPYRVIGGLTMALASRVGRERAMAQIAPGLRIGRFPTRSERKALLDREMSAVLGLCAEFPPPGGYPSGVATAYVPILDASPPTDRQFREALDWIEARRAEGRSILIHCAQGHGRSAIVLAVALVRLGLAADLDEAIERVRSARPKARPSEAQRAAAIRFLAGFEIERASPTARPPGDLPDADRLNAGR